MEKVKRKIIEIDDEKCNGCEVCIPNCPEGALRIIDKKARLVSDLFCDGLGACIGTCPQGAIKIIERDAEPYDERKVMEKIVRQGKNVIKAHLEHLKEHGEEEYLKEAVNYLEEKGIENPVESRTPDETAREFHSCPGSRVMDFRSGKKQSGVHAGHESELGQWPIQLHLVPPFAPYFRNAELVIAADCVPFAYADFHQDFLKGNAIAIGCPKLDDVDAYIEKISEIIKTAIPKSIKVVHMEVPCCFGLVHIVREAIKKSGKNMPFEEITISIKGEKL